MASPGINAQAGALTMADVPDLRRFADGGTLAILDWPDTAAALLAVLDAAHVPVTMFRWCTDPRGWPGWPGDYLKRCPRALFGNEPDREGWPAWYADASRIWYQAGGLPVDPAFSDESKWHQPPGGVSGHAHSVHVYPLGRGAANLAAVRTRANGRPVFVTEFGIAGQQATCLQQIAADGITEPTFLYTYRARDAQAQPAYDIAGVALLPATPSESLQDAPQGTEPPQSATLPIVTRIGHSMPAPLFQFTQDAGSSDCWVECIRSFFLRYGYPLPLDTVFQAGKGHARPAGGEAANFAEVKHAVTVLAQQLGVTVQEADFDDPNTVAAALHDPNTTNPWTVIAGVKEADLQPGQSYGHFIILDHEDSAGNVQVIDSYTNVDGNQSGRYPFSSLAQAMIDNWEPLIDAVGVKITGRAA